MGNFKKKVSILLIIIMCMSSLASYNVANASENNIGESNISEVEVATSGTASSGVDVATNGIADGLGQDITDGEYSTNSSSSSGSDTSDYWFYNTGTSLPQNPDYSKYNLLQVVKAGDILYEAEGGGGYTGHISIVEGIFYDTNRNTFYIRLVEAIGYSTNGEGHAYGVCRSVLDDYRFDERGGTILRVTDASTTQKQAAINFCIGQIGKKYNIGHEIDSSPSGSVWYCSELVWAAYYNQGIDMNVDALPDIVLPNEIRDCNKVITISVGTIGTPSITSIVSTGTTSAEITWSQVSNATYYYVYRSTSRTGGYSLIGSTNAVIYTDTMAKSGLTYYYRVSASDGSKYGNQSTPRGIRMSFGEMIITEIYPYSHHAVGIRWNSVYGATEYYVYRATSSTGTYTKIVTTRTPFYVDTNVTAGTAYYYKIVAYNGSAKSSYSGVRSATPNYIYPPTIYNIKKLESGVFLQFTFVKGAEAYYVYRSTSINGSYAYIGGSTRTYYKDTTSTSGNTYYYKVRVKDASGNMSIHGPSYSFSY